MLKGYYTVASGMLTQSQNLNVISNNMANVSTPGYKRDVLVPTTFQDELIYRTGNINKSRTPLASSSMITAADEVVTNYEKGAFQETNLTFDFAINSDGFFEVQTDQGSVYTRNGSFVIDNEGYLALQHVGRVMGDNGPILVETDQIDVDQNGRITAKEGSISRQAGAVIGKLRVVNFNDYAQLQKIDEGMFRNADNQNIVPVNNAEIKWKTIERSNVNNMDEMMAMMTSQRALQSASQVVKIYDQLMGKIVTEIGKV